MFAPITYRFIMTVIVDTPRGARTASSVFEVKAGRSPNLLPDEASRDWTVTGEAVAVDILPGKRLFALLRTVNPMRADLAQVSMAALDPEFNNDIVESAERISDGMGIQTSADLSLEDLPLLVTFRDLSDPKSIMIVEPGALDAAFGPGVALQRITIERTERSITNSLERELTWLNGFAEERLDSDFEPTTSPTLAQQLRQGDFRRGAI